MTEVILYVFLGMFLVLFIIKRASGSDKQKKMQRREKLSLRKHRLSRKELEDEADDESDNDDESLSDDVMKR